MCPVLYFSWFSSLNCYKSVLDLQGLPIRTEDISCMEVILTRSRSFALDIAYADKGVQGQNNASIQGESVKSQLVLEAFLAASTQVIPRLAAPFNSILNLCNQHDGLTIHRWVMLSSG